MNDELFDLLSQIEAGLVRLGCTKLLGALSPGVPGYVTRALLASRGLESTPDLEALYEWHDGCRDDRSLKRGDLYVFPGFYFPSMEHSLLDYDALVRSDRWAKTWFPVLADGGGDFYVTDLGPASGGQVLHFMIDQPVHPTCYLSLRDMLRTMAVGYERHLFTLDELGYLTKDSAAFLALAAELNPAVPWWNDLL